MTSETSPPPRVLLYGDSLAWEAEDHFRGAFAAVDVALETRTFGGTAICDWLPAMAEDAAEDPPVAVVVAFSGNALTPCAQDAAGMPLQGEDLRARYRADAEAAVAIFERVGSRVYLAGAPAGRADDPGASLPPGWVNTLYAEIATATAASFVDAGASVLDAGRWTATLPCLPGEPCQGGVDDGGRPVNVVRAPDGAHFCPTGDEARDGVTGACTAWSSGAYRFGRALADPVLKALPAMAPHAAGIR